MSLNSVDLSRLLDHPGAYISYDTTTRWLYLNLMPQVQQAKAMDIPGTSISAELDREGRTIGLSIRWDPTTGGAAR